MAGYGKGFGGFGGGNQMQQLMKQAQKMQEQMQKAQEELEDTEVEGSAGGDAVVVVMNGKKVVSSITIKPEIVDDKATVFMAKEIAKQIESEMEYPGQIKVNVIREMRSVEYAK